MLLTLITDVIGQPPAGWEFVVYLVAVFLFIIIVVFILNLMIKPFLRFFRGFLR